MDKINHINWLNKGPWCIKEICSRLHGCMFESFITHTRTERYNLLCYLVEHDKAQLAYKDDEISIEDRLIFKHIITEAL